ncbi:MAG TPA: hypothetical protein VIK21_08580 [Desulfuromonadaceae bacterium]
MSAYADLTFYKDTYGGTVIPDVDFTAAMIRGSREVDRAASFKIGIIDWPEFTRNQIKLAACAQAEYDYQYGELAQAMNAVGSYSIGDISVSSSQGAGLVTGSGISVEAEAYLLPTGLLYRGV